MVVHSYHNESKMDILCILKHGGFALLDLILMSPVGLHSNVRLPVHEEWYE